MITMDMTCIERRGGREGDKMNRMTEEAIAPEQKNQYAFNMFVRIAISHYFKKAGWLLWSTLF